MMSKVSPFCHQKKDHNLIVAAAAETASPTDITDLDPELADFCSHLNITPAIREFHDEDETGSDLCVSNQSSDIEEESELKKFTQALQMAQINALKNKTQKKKTVYSKKLKRTLKCQMQFHNKMASKGFLSVDKYMQLKNKTKESNNADTPKVDNIITTVQEESEEDSDGANVLVKETCAYRSVNSTVEVESKEDLPVHNVQLQCRHHIRIVTARLGPCLCAD